ERHDPGDDVAPPDLVSLLQREAFQPPGHRGYDPVPVPHPGDGFGLDDGHELAALPHRGLDRYGRGPERERGTQVPARGGVRLDQPFPGPFHGHSLVFRTAIRSSRFSRRRTSRPANTAAATATIPAKAYVEPLTTSGILYPSVSNAPISAAAKK